MGHHDAFGQHEKPQAHPDGEKGARAKRVAAEQHAAAHQRGQDRCAGRVRRLLTRQQHPVAQEAECVERQQQEDERCGVGHRGDHLGVLGEQHDAVLPQGVQCGPHQPCRQACELQAAVKCGAGGLPLLPPKGCGYQRLHGVVEALVENKHEHPQLAHDLVARLRDVANAADLHVGVHDDACAGRCGAAGCWSIQWLWKQGELAGKLTVGCLATTADAKAWEWSSVSSVR